MNTFLRGNILAMLLLTLLALGSAGLAQDKSWPEGVTARIKAGVHGGLYEHSDFRATLSLDAERLAAALQSQRLPAQLTVSVHEEGQQESIPCLAELSMETNAGLKAGATLDISFLVRGKLPVMGHRDFEIFLGGKAGPVLEPKVLKPFVDMAPVETRLFLLETREKGILFRLDPQANKDVLPFNGDFELDPWCPSSVGPGWNAMGFMAADDLRPAWTDADDDAKARPGKAAYLCVDLRSLRSSSCYGFVCSPFEVTPGARYRLTYSAKAKIKKDAQEKLIGSASLKLIGAAGGDDLAAHWAVDRQHTGLTRDWTSYEEILPVPYGARWGYLIFRAKYTLGFYWDNIKLTRLDELPAEYRFDSAATMLVQRLDKEDGDVREAAWDPAAGSVTLISRTNLVSEGSFEDDTGWEISDTGKEYVIRSEEQKWDGRQALKFGPLPDAVKTSPLVTVKLKRALLLDSQKPYVLFLYYRATSSSGDMAVRLETADGAILANDVLPGRFLQKPGDLRGRIGNPWIRRRILIPAGLAPGAVTPQEATLSFRIRPSKKGPFYLDAVGLVEGVESAPFSPNKTFANEGQVVSRIIDLGTSQDVQVCWDADAPEGTSLDLFTRTGNTDSYDPATWDTWRPLEEEGLIPALGRGFDTYMQWKAVLKTTRAETTPRLMSVVIHRTPDAKPLRSPRVRITALHNGEITTPSLQFLSGFEPLDKLEKQSSYRALRDIAVKVTEPYSEEFDKQMALFTYVWANMNNRYDVPSGTRLSWPMEGTLADKCYFLLDTGKREGSACSAMAIVYVMMCRTLGIPARGYGLCTLDGGGHDTGDTWSDRYQKWIFTDVLFGGLLTYNGVPQSILELHELFQADKYHEVRILTSARWRSALYSMSDEYGKLGEAQYVGRHNASPVGQLFYSAKWYRDPDFCFMDDEYYHKKSYVADDVAGKEYFQFKLNQVEFTFAYAGGDTVEVRLRQNGLDFDHYAIEANGRQITQKADSYQWKLVPGPNRISARTVSRQGHKGKAFIADLWLEAP